jgi:hypothetical protein
MLMFQGIEAKTYERTDVPGSRLGFVAQDVAQVSPGIFGNLVHTVEKMTKPCWLLSILGWVVSCGG